MLKSIAQHFERSGKLSIRIAGLQDSKSAVWATLHSKFILTGRGYFRSQIRHSSSDLQQSARTEHVAFLPHHQDRVSTDVRDGTQDSNPRLHPTSNKPIFDEDYIRTHNQVPTNLDYPEILERIDENPKGVVHNTPRRNFKLNAEFLQASQADVIQCNIHAYNTEILGGKHVVGVGEGRRKKIAEKAAYLHVVAQLHKSGALKLAYAKAAKNDKLISQDGQAVRPTKQTHIEVDDRSARIMDQAIDRMQNNRALVEVNPRTFNEPRRKRQAELGMSHLSSRSLFLRQRLEVFNRHPAHEQVRMNKAGLPMNHYRNQIIDLVENNTYSIVIGATGSGKTSQLPQIIFEHAILMGLGAKCNIICTQPRRIAAVSLARRVAIERGESMQDTVGYQVRMDSMLARKDGSIMYCTTGVLLARLQHDLDNVLESYSHLIIDEVHERTVQIDFLLVIIKQAINDRLLAGKPAPKVVLMSATIDAELFERYLERKLPTGESIPCPTMIVPGRSFPVTEKYFDDIWASLQQDHQSQLGFLESDPITAQYVEQEQKMAKTHTSATEMEIPGSGNADDKKLVDQLPDGTHQLADLETSSNKQLNAIVPISLAAAVVAHLAKTTQDGAILVFLPGINEILQLERCLRVEKPLGIDFQNVSEFKILMLHSSVSNLDQSAVFDSVPEGCRKIILATNIAETSVTIPDVKYVVDPGKLREKYYDQERRVTELQCTWISKSNSKQRAGRAGRVQYGYYYALFSKARFDCMSATGLSEMVRSDLQEVCLDVKTQRLKIPIADFLNGAIEPPQPEAVTSAIDRLKRLEALTETEELTPLGQLLASLPVHPALGKIIVLGVIFRCLDAMIIIGAAGKEIPLFSRPLGHKRESLNARRAHSQKSGSDHIAFLNAYRMMRDTATSKGDEAARDMAQRWFINYAAFRSIEATTQEIEKVLVRAGLIPPIAPVNMFNNNNEIGDPSLNEGSSNIPLIKALITAGSPRNIAVASTRHIVRTSTRGITAVVHPSSVKGPVGKADDSYLSSGELFTYNTLVKSATREMLFLREVSQISPLTAALFGGQIRQKPGSGQIIKLDNWQPLMVKGADDAAELLVKYRQELDRVLSRAFQDLSSRRRGTAAEAPEVGDGGEREYLAEKASRSFFVDGVVALLDLEATREKAGLAECRTQAQAKASSNGHNVTKGEGTTQVTQPNFTLL